MDNAFIRTAGVYIILHKVFILYNNTKFSYGVLMLSYKDSGVDIDEGNALVDGLKPLVQSTFDANVIGGVWWVCGGDGLASGN